MVQLEEERAFAVNYFRFAADAVITEKACADGNKKKCELNLDRVELKASPMCYEQQIEQLLKFYADKVFPQLKFEFENDFNLMLYGFGSKRNLLLQLEAYMNVHSIFIDAHGLNSSQVSHEFIAAGINLEEPSNQAVSVFIHGLDAHKLRNELFYRRLAEACHSRYIRLIATMEDPNFPILISPKLFEKFNFVFHDCTTYAPYQETELSHLPDQNTGRTVKKRSIKGALFVLASLTPNARAIFKLLAEQHLNPLAMQQINESDSEDEEEDSANSMSQQDLFKLVQSKFLISSDSAFRTILTEFIDHELVKVVRSSLNGGEALVIPFSNSNIREIISMMASM